MRKIPRGLALSSVLALALLLLAALPGCAYVAKQARGQLRLLAGRVPIERALAEEELAPDERANLEAVAGIKAFGEALGLSPSKNYTTINPDFDEVVWNVSGCAPHRFESHVYRYPIVGALPYIGFFDRKDADAERQRLLDLGWEVYVRPAGAYSSLGWFKDPLWRSMLRWGREQLANTVLHELAHATLWLKGEGSFNESYAAFVGDQATERWLKAQGDPALWEQHVQQQGDGALYRDFMHALVLRLQGLYGAGLGREATMARRALIFEQARREYRQLPFHAEGYAAALDPDRELNNARLVQFRVYNTGGERFEAALERFGGDLSAFLEASKGLEEEQKRTRDFDPWTSLDELLP